ncbi:hypothetical protein GCM10025771_15710 [Niveibacterium umoris]|uniref:DUF642 domain-containing protein n=1 Tax=Niveibacterium umoris TaxID=1193620 RepID=A0A840BSQ7_9RHOO|nr:DUF642 domain-containing protein [Niveibacterium umoris]MBB4014558.1 hypothetical protein [Niveibacterium umoris]
MTPVSSRFFRAALVSAAGFALIGAASAAPINLIENGSFESVSQKAGTWNIYSSLAGWQVGGKGVEIRDNVAGTAYDGKNFVELDTTKNSWISQAFETTIGQSYKVSFFYSPRQGVASNSNDILALLNGTVAKTASGSGIGKSGNVWQEIDFNFVATGPMSTLGFMAAGVSDSYGGSLDKVSVSAVPEPSSWATLLAGLLGLGVITRRRTR